MNSDPERDGNNVIIPGLPVQAATVFKDKCSKMKLQFELEQTQR